MSSSRVTFRLGIVGCGRVADERHVPALRQLTDVKVTAAADTDAARLSCAADRWGIEHRFSDYRGLLDRTDIDAVAILTPTESHAEIALAAIDAGKHVLIEKPLALTLAECDQLISSSAASPCKVLLGFNLRWHRLVRRARTFVETGALGPIHVIRSAYTHDRTGQEAPGWHRKVALGGGVVLNEAVHHFDLWRHLLQCEVERIASFNRSSADYEDETHITSACLSNQIMATGLFTIKTSPNSEIEIYGERGRLHLSCYRFDGLEFFPHETYPGDMTDRLKKTARALRELPQAVQAGRRGGDFAATFYTMWRHFFDCIEHDEVAGCTPEDGKRTLEIALAAVDSAASERVVQVAARNPESPES